MNVIVYGTVVVIFLAGIWGVVSSRNMIHQAVSFLVFQSSTYLLLLSIGFRSGGQSPILSPPSSPQGVIVDPIVQSLALTDIVVGVTVASMLIAIAIQAHKKTGSLHPDSLSELKG